MKSELVLILVAGCSFAEGMDGTIDTDADADGSGAIVASRCTVTATLVACVYESAVLSDGIERRDVQWQVPIGTAPAEGWPAVILFQGSLAPSRLCWNGASEEPFGAYDQAATVAGLLDAGYAVITPATRLAGSTFWDTNIPPFDVAWYLSPDRTLMLALFDAIGAGTFGPLDGARLYAAGVSSGGYMTSRVAFEFSGRFRAAAIVAGSYAMCGGPACTDAIIPDIPVAHPPTIFLHREFDLAVPLWTMRLYEDKLHQSSIATRSVIAAGQTGHGWIVGAPVEVVAWFDNAP